MDKNMLLVGRLCESAYPAINSSALPRSVSFPREMAESTAQDLAYDEDFMQPFEPLAYHSGSRAGHHSGLDSAVSNLDLFAQLELAQHLDYVRSGANRFSSANAAAAAAAAGFAVAAAAGGSPARLANSSMSDQMSRSDSCLAAVAAAAADAEAAGVGKPLFDPEDDAAVALATNIDGGMAISIGQSQSSANVRQILGKSASPNYQVVVGMDASVAMSGTSAGSNMSTWMALAKSNKRFVSTSDLEASDATVDEARPTAAAAAPTKPPMTTWTAVRTSSIKDIAAASSSAGATKTWAGQQQQQQPSNNSGGESAWRQLKSAGGSRLVSWQELNRIVRDARPLDAADQKSRHEMSSSTTQQTAVAWRKQQQPEQPKQAQQQTEEEQLLLQQQQLRQQQQQNRYSGTLLELFKRATNTPTASSMATAPAAHNQAAAVLAAQPESTLRFLHGGGPGFREFRRRARELVDHQQQFPTGARRSLNSRGSGVGRSNSDLQHGRRAGAAHEHLPSLGFLRDSLPLGEPSTSASIFDPAGDSGIGTAVGDGSVSTPAASSGGPSFVCRNCGHPQHQQQQSKRGSGVKQKRSQSLDTTAVAAAAAAAATADEADGKSAERHRRAAARRRLAAAADSAGKKQRALGGGAKRTRSEPHRLAGAAGLSGVYEMTQSLTDSQEDEAAAASTNADDRQQRSNKNSSAGQRDYADDDDEGGGGFRAKKSVSFCDRIQFHSPKGRAPGSPTGGQVWRAVGSTADLGGVGAGQPANFGDAPHRQQTLLRRPLSLQLNYDVQVIPQQVGLYGDNDSPPLVFCGSPVGSPRRSHDAAAAAAASSQLQQTRLDKLGRLVTDAIRGVNDLILAATASPLAAAAAADASDQQRQQQRLASVLAQSLCPPLHGLLTDELVISGGGGSVSGGSRLSFVRNRSQLWQLIEETCKPGSQPASRRLNECLRLVRSVNGLSTERLKFNAFVAACLNSKQLSAWFHHATASESILKRYYKPSAFLRSAQTVHCELFADLSTSLELLNSHSFSIDLTAAGSASSSTSSTSVSRKSIGQQPLKARHDIKATPPPPPPQHQRASAPAPPPRVQSRLPRPTGPDYSSASSVASSATSATSPAPSVAPAFGGKSSTKSGGGVGGIRSTLSGLMRRPGSSSSSSSKQQQSSTGKR